MDHHCVVVENRATLQETVDFGLRELGASQWQAEVASEAAGELANVESGPAAPEGRVTRNEQGTPST